MTTGYVYDPLFLEHTHPRHPESAARLEAVWQAIEDAGLRQILRQIPGRAATEAELEYGHAPAYIRRIAQTDGQPASYLNPDTYITPHSFQAARLAVGSLIDLTLAVVDGDLSNGFALIRPPGHHATPTQAMGFCLFSNVALAALAAQRARGLERIAVIVFDVHHGNGTQAILNAQAAVFFCSSHQYPHYPGTGRATDIGSGAALGTKMNFPLPVGAGDEAFKTLYRRILTPALRRFKPQLLLVSAGYDAHRQDPLASLGLSLAGLARISQTLVSLADELCAGKIVFSLEGGYNLPVLGLGVANSLKALLHRTDFSDPFGPSPQPEPDITRLLQTLKSIHQLE